MFTWENSHRREFQNRMTFWFRIAFTWWLGDFMPRYLKVHFTLIKYMRYLIQSTGRQISHRNGWSFGIYMIPALRDFVPEWNSCPDTRTGVNARRGDSRRHDILWWYHVNRYRAMRWSRSELVPGRTSSRRHVNTSLVCQVSFFYHKVHENPLKWHLSAGLMLHLGQIVLHGQVLMSSMSYRSRASL